VANPRAARQSLVASSTLKSGARPPGDG
jgi:hypothetical protein